MKSTDASQLDFTGWFEREAALIKSACKDRHSSCTRVNRSTMNIGAASIDLMQLQRALDQRPENAMAGVVRAWVDKAIAIQDGNSVQARLTTVYPHLRSPRDQTDVPWIQKLANERLLCCLVSEDEEAMHYLGPVDILRFHQPQDHVLERAKCNLSLLPPYSLADCTPHPDCPDAWIIETGDGHDAARLLIADMIAGDAAVVWIPHRDRMVLSTVKPNKLNPWVDRLRAETIAHAQQAKHPITAEAFLVNNGVISHLRYRRSGGTGQLLEDGFKPLDAPP